MKRREFSKTISFTGILLSGVINNFTEGKRKKRLAPRLQKGDTIGLIAPASAVSEEKIQKAIDNIKSLGFKVKEGENLRKRYGYLAGKDEERLSDIHNMYSDKNVNGIWCVRGGYGCTRILKKLDFALIKRNPKVLIGYSDVTALLNAIYQETGLIGFHGPVASSDFNAYNNKSLHNFTMMPVPKVVILQYEGTDADYDSTSVLVPGSAEGRIVGGNLSLLAAMVGTKHEVKCANNLVFIEDVGEEPYRIDRMLTQLIDATDLRKSNAIILGQFKGCNPDNPETSLSLLECLKDRFLPLNIPIFYGLNFGHVTHNFCFPIGVKARIKSDPLTLEVLEETVL